VKTLIKCAALAMLGCLSMLQVRGQCSFSGTISATPNCSGQGTVVLRICSAPYPNAFDTYQIVSSGNTYVGTYSDTGGACKMVTWTGVADGVYKFKLNNNAACDNYTVTVTSIQPTTLSISADRSPLLCQGESITLQGNGGANYSWSSSAGDSWPMGTTSITITPQTTTIYTLNGTASGCGDSSPKTMQVSVTPTVGSVSITAGITARCQGVGQNPFVGTTATNASNYIWSLTPAGAGSITPTGVANWSASFSGTATVTYQAVGCGTSSDSRSVVVNASPDVTLVPSGTVNVPAGVFQTELRAPQVTGYQYQWKKDGTFLPWITGYIATASSSGSYTVNITTASGCTATSQATQVAMGKDRNYIIERNVQIDKMPTGQPVQEGDIPGIAIGDKIENYTFFDGIGRPVQHISTAASPSGGDVVQPQVYDDFGRETVKYLPYVSPESQGWYKDNTTLQQQAFYNQASTNIAQDNKPYTKTIVEPSPLNRVLKQGAPGEVWQPDNNDYGVADKTIKKNYESNADNEVLLFTYDMQSDVLSVGDALSLDFYDPNTLTATITIDENKNEIVEYVDNVGKTICKKVQFGVEGTTKLYACTYYIYDENDKLLLVLPPEAVVEILKQHQP